MLTGALGLLLVLVLATSGVAFVTGPEFSGQWLHSAPRIPFGVAEPVPANTPCERSIVSVEHSKLGGG